MTISVLIPAHSAAGFIGVALECLRRQTLADWEVVVIEDGSSDGTEALVSTFARSVTQPVRYHNLGSHLGISRARNESVARSTGEFLAFLDADDYWDDHYLQAVVDQMKLGSDLVVSTARAFDLASGAELYRRIPPERLVENPLVSQIADSIIITPSSVAMTRSLYERIGPFGPDLRMGEDRDYWVRCALGGARFGRSLNAVAHYAKHSGGMLSKILNWAEQDVKFHRKFHDLPQVPVLIRRRVLGDALENLGRLLRRGDPRRSAACLFEAWRLAPLRLRRLAYAGYSLICMLRTPSAKLAR